MTADSQSPFWKKLVDSLADAPLTSVEKSVLVNKFMEFQKRRCAGRFRTLAQLKQIAVERYAVRLFAIYQRFI
jgi:hypothetical protein